MQYQKIYDQLVQKARTRDWRSKRNRMGTNDPPCYVETHHIVPRALGGTDHHSNLVVLSAREHFIAHRLLHKIHRSKSTAAALVALSFAKDLRKLTARQFAILRVMRTEASSGPLSPEQLRRHHEVHRGRKRPPETGRRISERMKGRTPHNKGMVVPEHIRAKMRKPKRLRYGTCVNCGLTAALHSISRYHNNNCKHIRGSHSAAT